MSALSEQIKRQWIAQTERDIRELLREGSAESLQMARLLQEALDECMLELTSPDLYLEGSVHAQNDKRLLEGALDFMRSRRH